MLASSARLLACHSFKYQIIYRMASKSDGMRFKQIKMPGSNHIVWVDMEMTGLDVEKDKILEIGCVITDSNLKIVAEGPNIIIHQPDEVLNSMNDWCICQHGETGLTEASRNSKINLRKAETEILDFISKHVPEKKCPLAGNSIYMDRYFLKKHMPRIDDYLHYRLIDVSAIKEICRRWNMNVYKNMPIKKLSHRALNDIYESIEELKYYKNNFMVIT